MLETCDKEVIQCDTLERFPVPVIRVCGTPGERGLEYGKQAKELIRESVGVNDRLLALLRGNGVGELNRLAGLFLKALRFYDSDALEEMQGIAEGAQVPLEDILRINLMPELMNPYCTDQTLGCTTVGIKNKLIYTVGQTYDWFQECKDLLVVLHFREGEREGLMFTQAGCIGGIGMNNRGLAVLLNYLNNYYIRRDGASYHCLLRRALWSDSIEDAQRNILRSPAAYGLNLLLASEDGMCMDYELTARGADFYVLGDREDAYVHTNHYRSDRLKTRIINQNIWKESKGRYDAAKTYFREHQEDPKRMKHCFMQHQENTPVCRHADEQNSAQTLYAVRFDLKERVLSFQHGLPCQSREYQISFDRLFNR
ncbi:MAG: hypothetical protein K0S04_1794 [Herbinix sp.]|jgi:isopenicillin-N N-acyltransferase-like protein|nr:hypothetical protein [Herbinix sp.]